MKKTIAFTIHSLYPGGAERVISSLANHLVTENFNVKIITLVKCEPFYELHPNIKLLSCDSSHSQSQNIIGSVKNHITTIKTISTFIKKENIDLLIGFTPAVNVLSIISAKLNRIPVIISERSNVIAISQSKFKKIFRNILYKYSDYLIIQTKGNIEYYSKIIHSKKIVIIKNPISPTLASKRILNKNNTKSKIILTVGRLDANKAQDLLIRAFSNISHTNDWQIQLIGDGKKKEEYMATAERLKIKDRVSFMGNLSNVHDYYNNAGIFVFTSKSEGFPNALAEALYFGLPSISTNCPYGPSELIEHNKNGLLIEVDNQNMLEIQLKRLMDDEDLRNNLGKNALKESEMLDIHLITGLWIDCFNKVLV